MSWIEIGSVKFSRGNLTPHQFDHTQKITYKIGTLKGLTGHGRC